MLVQIHLKYTRNIHIGLRAMWKYPIYTMQPAFRFNEKFGPIYDLNPVSTQISDINLFSRNLNRYEKIKYFLRSQYNK